MHVKGAIGTEQNVTL